MTGEVMGLGLWPWPQFGGLLQSFLYRTEGQLQEEVRHYEMVSQVEESVFLLVLRKKPQGVITCSLNTSIPVVINQAGPSGIRPVLWPIKIQEIPQGVTQFMTIQPPENCPATSAPLLRIKRGELSRELLYNWGPFLLFRLQACLLYTSPSPRD